MSKVIEPPRLRGGSQEIKSQVALEIMLNVFAVVGAAVILRSLLLTIGVNERLWLGETIYRFTDPLVLPLTILPGSGFTILRSLTLADLTLLACVVLFPLGLYARGAKKIQT